MGCPLSMCNSLRNAFNQITFQATSINALYLASVGGRAIIDYNLLLQNTGLPLNLNKNPVLDFFLSGSWA